MRGTVLIVHDDMGVRRGLGEFLQSSDYKVLSAATGQEALAVLEEDVPRLLVIGVGLPLMSGWKLIEALAHYPDLSRIPRLLVNPGDELAHVCKRALEALAEKSEAQTDGELTPTPVNGHRRMANA
ncbi:MAG TPA: response regulator [Polyangia bacterium]|jgi:CheY-like chemotaxis protein|nr:response regulator [Polyangia bacterium]